MQNFGESHPQLTLSIISHGDSGKVSSLLRSLQKYESVDNFQIILTDNLGDELPELADSFWPLWNIIRNQSPQGFARNHNRAFKIAQGKYFCILNPDVIFVGEVFQRLIENWENQQADIVAPIIVDADGSLQDSYRNFPTPVEIVRRRLPGYQFSPPSADAIGLVRPDWIAGTFMLMRSETYRELNGFDEKYHLYFEDVDLCARAQLAGMELLVDTNIRIQHNAHRASRRRLIYLLWHIQSAFRFFTSPVYKKIKQSSR